MKNIAFLFPGQGSQTVGMGADLYQEFDFVRELFDMAEEITRLNLSKLCFKGPMEDLTMTVNLQPAVTVVNLAFLSALEKEGICPNINAGHSLGEYSALNASGAVSKEDTFSLVHKRGELMHREATIHKGVMHAIVGLPIKTVDEIVSEVNKDIESSKNQTVSVANHNTETQIAITGSPDQVKKASSIASEKGARAIPLKVSGAWHSDLIKNAEKEFKEFLDQFTFTTPESPIVFNVTADVITEPDDIKAVMSKQLCSPVRWFDSMQKLMEENVEVFVEVGPGKVIAGMLKKILPKTHPGKIYNINDMKSFEQFFNEVK